MTDGEQRAALAVVRSLGHAGHLPIVCSHDARPLAGASRHAAAVETVPDPLTSPEAFVETVARIVRARSVRLVMPVAEQSHLPILAHRDRLAPAIVTAGTESAFRALSSKDAVLRTAAQLGIAVPPQHEIPTIEAIPQRLDAALFPAVLKPARSVHDGAMFRVSYADDADDARGQLAAMPDAAFPVLLQRRIVGQGSGVFLLVWNGEVRAAFAHRRLREQPPSGGASVYCEAIPLDQALLDRSVRLLRAFAWEGVAMVEYKVDQATATPYLMEVNSRFWGSLQLAIDAGVDFPALLADAALGGTSRGPATYRTDARLRSWWGDVDHLLVRLRHAPERLSLPPDAPSRAHVLTDFLRWRLGDRIESLRLDDARPFFTETRQWLATRFGRDRHTAPVDTALARQRSPGTEA